MGQTLGLNGPCAEHYKPQAQNDKPLDAFSECLLLCKRAIGKMRMVA
jgi:hypothetical protein